MVTDETGNAIGAVEFRRLMARFAPFESEPVIAVAVSGGADSMALALLADGWARARRGKIIALTVDHGLRHGSRTEATEAHRRLVSRNIESHVLTWHGVKPATGIQAAARDARYGLMVDWCRRHGILHLLLAHHRDDQAETFLHRLSRSSGSDGLAGMAACREVADVRFLRPCLHIPRERLRAVLVAKKLPWSEDPSNSNAAFARVRIRSLMPSLALEGLDAATLADTTRRLSGMRALLEGETARLLAKYATLYAAGYAEVALQPLKEMEHVLGLRVLAALVTCIGGAVFSPRQARLSRLYEALLAEEKPAARTLGGCRVLRRGDYLLVVREAGRCPVVNLQEGASTLWDSRYGIDLRRPLKGKPRRCTIQALGDTGWAKIRDENLLPLAYQLPRAARAALPALYLGNTIAAVPHLGYARETSKSPGVLHANVRFMPAKPASSVVFPVA